MRDAFGGAFLMKLLIIFIMIYVVFMAIALNYAKAFKVKNKIIDIIEQYEGHNVKADTAINAYLDKADYYVSAGGINANNYTCFNNGGTGSQAYCLRKYQGSVGGIPRSYYTVYTFIKLEFPFFRLSMTVPIKGETRLIAGYDDIGATIISE